ncbi:MAG TPA: prepilin peptidase [Geminicoccaceae bacterium]|nr:prepilin peptidase [Geminicoccaceae bacterium]
MILSACLVLLLAAAAVWDFAALRIPNPLTLGLVALCALRALADPLHFPWLEHLAAGLAVFLVTLGLFHFRLIGGGDLKLLTGTALWLGLGGLPAHLVLVALSGAALALLLLAARPLVWPLLARLPMAAAPWIPRALEPGAGVPYGVPIALSAIVLAMR